MNLSPWREFPKVHFIAHSLLCKMRKLHGVLVSYSCPDKLPQTWWLNTIEMYYLTDLEGLAV